MAGGRKGKYHSHVEPKLLLIEAWARDGFTLEQIAEKLGVAASTFFDYKNKYPELSEALKKGQEVADVEVENALFKRAVGYRYDEVTRESDKVIDPESGQIKTVMVETKRVTKEVQPDVTAQIFWLKNRRPDVWRDKKDVNTEVAGSLQIESHDLRKLSPEELKALEQILTKSAADSG
ncbi:transposase [Paenibacillus chibensis]|uniref:Transposase n=1 Tax=Paenibacillus chibensis TaxID=59846 RepID=A0ABU6PYY9_9BACL|nr:transposase [Paenibacillus chibensis]